MNNIIVHGRCNFVVILWGYQQSFFQWFQILFFGLFCDDVQDSRFKFQLSYHISCPEAASSASTVLKTVMLYAVF